VEPSPLLQRALIGLLHHLWPIDGDDCGAVIRMDEKQRKPKHLEKPAPVPLSLSLRFHMT
jgi:hypothetical protein